MSYFFILKDTLRAYGLSLLQFLLVNFVGWIDHSQTSSSTEG